MASLQLAVAALDRRQATHHSALVGSDEVGLLGLLELDALNVLLMLFPTDPNQLATLNSFEFVI
jgi:hypothetical protein